MTIVDIIREYPVVGQIVAQRNAAEARLDWARRLLQEAYDNRPTGRKIWPEPWDLACDEFLHRGDSDE